MTGSEFFRRSFVRIALGFAIVTLTYRSLCIYIPYQRERRIALAIENDGLGKTIFEYVGPYWVPESVKLNVACFQRIAQVHIRNGVPDDAIREVGLLTNVRELLLEDVHISEDGWNQIKRLKRLTRLCITGKQFTDAELAHLKEMFGLEDLYLNDTSITDTGLAGLNGLTALQILELRNTEVSDVGLDQLNGFRRLKQLALSHTRVTDAGLARIKGLTTLIYVALDHTQTTPTGRESLRDALPMIRKVYPEP